MKDYKIHNLAEVASDKIGSGTTVWQFSVILEGAKIGKDCNINAHTFIEGDVVIGNKVTIKCGVQVWSGVRIEDDVFIGPNVTFTNDITPRSKRQPDKYTQTFVRKGASIGANATLIAGVDVGEFALVGAGSVITKNIVSHALVYGNPAKRHGWVCECGSKLENFECGSCKTKYAELKGLLEKIKQ